MAAAQDTGGEAAAGPFYDAAKATFESLIDARHTVSALYGMVNVPTAVMIDEEGRVIRQDEGAYTRRYQAGTLSFGTDEYVPALRDWVRNGDHSPVAHSEQSIGERLPQRSASAALADAEFRLGAFFFERGEHDLAERHWHEAERLNPDSWNYHRQDWSFTPSEAGRRWLEKYRSLDGKPYYAPMNLPPLEAKPPADARPPG